MKRAEVLLEVDNFLDNENDFNNIKKLINKIYDDFEIESQQQICKNCKYFVECNDGYHYCNNINNTGLNGIITPDFGCNRFEKKENKKIIK